MSILFAPVAFLMFLAIIGLIVLAVVLFVRAKPATRRVLGLCLVVAVILPLGLAIVRLGRSQVGRVTNHRSVEQSPIVAISAETDSTRAQVQSTDAWQSAVDKTFEANIYPSLRSAAKALAHKLAPLLSALTPDKQPPSMIQISGQSLQLPADADRIVADVAEALRQEIEGVQVLVESITPTAGIERRDAGAVSVKIDLPSRTVRHGTAWDQNFEELTGPLRAEARGRAAGPVTCDVRFIDKPWVDDYAAFISTRPGRQWLKGQSSELASSQHEAETQAYRAAAVELSQRVMGMIQQRRSRPSAAPSQAQVIEALVAAMRRGEFVVDKFAQRLSRPYGDVWRQTILLDVQSDSLSTIAAGFVREGGRTHRALRTAWLGRVLSVGGLIAFICVVYAFLNMATRGYYTWSLRLALMLMAIGGVVLLMVVA